MSWSAAAPPVGAGGRSPAPPPPGGRIRTACCVPQKPRGVGGGASGRRRGHQGGAPRWGWCPYRETPELLAPPAMRGRSEKTRSVNQEVGSRQTLHPLGPRPRPASCRKGGRHPPAAVSPPGVDPVAAAHTDRDRSRGGRRAPRRSCSLAREGRRRGSAEQGARRARVCIPAPPESSAAAGAVRACIS